MYFDSNQFDEIVTNQFDLQSSSCTDHNQISLSQTDLQIADKILISIFIILLLLYYFNFFLYITNLILNQFKL